MNEKNKKLQENFDTNSATSPPTLIRKVYEGRYFRVLTGSRETMKWTAPRKYILTM